MYEVGDKRAQLVIASCTMAALEVLASLTTDVLASRLHILLLPDTEPSAETWKALADRTQQVALHLQLRATEADQLPTVTAQTNQQAALPTAPEAIQAKSHQAAAITAQQTSGLQTSGRKKRRQLGEIRSTVMDVNTYTMKLNTALTAAKPFLIEAYQQRFVALEIFYLGWRYHGFASQCKTEGTVEVWCQPA